MSQPTAHGPETGSTGYVDVDEALERIREWLHAAEDGKHIPLAVRDVRRVLDWLDRDEEFIARNPEFDQ